MSHGVGSKKLLGLVFIFFYFCGFTKPGIKNLELLPANGYSPKFGNKNVYVKGNAGEIELDLSTLPEGLQEFRISAFNKEAGAADAQEIVVMPVRQWNIRH